MRCRRYAVATDWTMGRRLSRLRSFGGMSCQAMPSRRPIDAWLPIVVDVGMRSDDAGFRTPCATVATTKVLYGHSASEAEQVRQSMAVHEGAARAPSRLSGCPLQTPAQRLQVLLCRTSRWEFIQSLSLHGTDRTPLTPCHRLATCPRLSWTLMTSASSTSACQLKCTAASFICESLGTSLRSTTACP